MSLTFIYIYKHWTGIILLLVEYCGFLEWNSSLANHSKLCVYVCVCVHEHACSVTQLCPTPTLCDPMDCSLPGSSVHRISQARILKCIAISFSRGSSQPRDQNHVSYVSCIGTRRMLMPLGWQGNRISHREDFKGKWSFIESWRKDNGTAYEKAQKLKGPYNCKLSWSRADFSLRKKKKRNIKKKLQLFGELPE